MGMSGIWGCFEQWQSAEISLFFGEVDQEPQREAARFEVRAELLVVNTGKVLYRL